MRTPLATARPDLPSAFVRIVDRALDPNPENRYDSPGPMGAELAWLVPSTADDGARSTIGFRRTWRFVALAATLAVAAGFGSAAVWWTSEPPIIAVMPFKNLSAEPKSEYFVDGLTDEIIRNLSVIEGWT